VIILKCSILPFFKGDGEIKSYFLQLNEKNNIENIYTIVQALKMIRPWQY
jgi:hypothetical protein